MIDTMTGTKVVGALCGALLIFLLGGWAAELIYHVEAEGGHGEEHAQAYSIEVADAGGDEATVEEGPSIEELFVAADPADGEGVFRACQSCHNVEDGANGVGPHLYGVVGRDVGSVDGYSYSGALSEQADVWTVANLNGFLTNPREWAPGTAMSYAGLKDAEDRAALIKWLDSLDGDITEVEVPAAAEASGEDMAAAGGEGGEAAAEGEGDSGGSEFAQLLASADPEAGEGLFRACQACHKLEEGANGVGPYLYDVVGREVGSVEGFRYSGALSEQADVWTGENLFAFLENPGEWAPGTAMGYRGMEDPQDRVNLIAWLDTVDGETDLAALSGDAGGSEDTAAAEEAPAEGEDMAATEEAPAEGEDVAAAEEAPAEAEDAAATEEAPAEGEDRAATEEAPAEGEDMAATEEAPAEGEDMAATEEAPAEGEDMAAAEDTAEGGDASGSGGEMSEAEQLVAAADPAEGQRIFRNCQACHRAEEGRNAVGPSLYGVVGRDIGTVDGFRYSGNLSKQADVWTIDNLFAFLENPQEWAPGTRMGYPGLKSPEDRAAVIAYLDSLDE